MVEASLEDYDWLMPLAPWEDPKTLKTAINSLQNQTWAAQKLIVSVDGKLPEKLKKVLNEYSLPMQILEADQWIGTGATLEIGINQCRSKWVLRADSDDKAHPNRAEIQLKYLAKNPNIAVLGGQLLEEWRDGKVQGVRKVPLTENEIYMLAYWRNPLNHPTVALNRHAVIKVGGYRNIQYFEDWDLWLRMRKNNMRMENLKDTLVSAGINANYLNRRRGFKYLKKEIGFLVKCAREGTIPLCQVAALVMIRSPWRFLPANLLVSVMRKFRATV